MALLFDQLMYDAFLRGHNFHEWLEGTPVYDVSNCRWLLGEMEKARLANERDRQIPKRPPHDSIWVEWKDDEATFDGQAASVTCGVFAETNHGPNTEKLKRTFNKNATLMSDEQGVHFSTFMHGLVFQRWDRAAKSCKVLGIPAVFTSFLFLGFTDDFKTSAMFDAEAPDDYMISLPFFRTAALENEVVNCYGTTLCDLFALLHCRNISTEEKRGGPRPKKGFKAGAPPYTYYKELRLTLPSSLRPHEQVADSPEAEARMRLHLCRGHFKNLQAERYKEKGWHWWPAHWRGDPDLGTVDKIYKPKGSLP